MPYFCSVRALFIDENEPAKAFLTIVRLPDDFSSGPDAAYETASVRLTDPIPTNRVFQIAFVVKTANISVKDLKQSLANNATSKKN